MHSGGAEINSSIDGDVTADVAATKGYVNHKGERVEDFSHVPEETVIEGAVRVEGLRHFLIRNRGKGSLYVHHQKCVGRPNRGVSLLFDADSNALPAELEFFSGLTSIKIEARRSSGYNFIPQLGMRVNYYSVNKVRLLGSFVYSFSNLTDSEVFEFSAPSGELIYYLNFGNVSRDHGYSINTLYMMPG